MGWFRRDRHLQALHTRVPPVRSPGLEEISAKAIDVGFFHALVFVMDSAGAVLRCQLINMSAAWTPFALLTSSTVTCMAANNREGAKSCTVWVKRSGTIPKHPKISRFVGFVPYTISDILNPYQFLTSFGMSYILCIYDRSSYNPYQNRQNMCLPDGCPGHQVQVQSRILQQNLLAIADGYLSHRTQS
jgi:hypothetical protein